MNLDDFLFDEQGCPIFPEIFPSNPPDIISLRVEVERVKRQKLRATLKRVRREIIPPHHIIAQIRHDMASLQENLR